MIMPIDEYLGILIAISGVAWFLWKRYRALELRFDAIEKQLLEIKHSMALLEKSWQSGHEMSGLLIKNNTELIETRTQALKSAINDVRRYLENTSDFRRRTENKE